MIPKYKNILQRFKPNLFMKQEELGFPEDGSGRLPNGLKILMRAGYVVRAGAMYKITKNGLKARSANLKEQRIEQSHHQASQEPFLRLINNHWRM